MGRTVNRQPFTVNVPDNKTQYFNHINWKGLCTNKNYFNIDQETFEDCKNVYMNDELLLNSRPSIKNYNVGNTADWEHVYSFDDLVIYQSYPTVVGQNKYINITFVINKDGESDTISYKYENAVETLSDVRFKLVQIYNKIVLCKYYNGKCTWYKVFNGNDFVDIESYVYIPIKNIITDNVESEYEELNELTTSYKTRYLYTNGNLPVNPPYIGKNVTVTIDGKSYSHDFVSGMENFIFSRQLHLNETNYYSYNAIGLTYPMLDFSDRGSMILSSFVPETNTWTISYSVDGITWTSLPPPGEIIGIPTISKKGDIVVVIKSDGPYAYSVVGDSSSGAHEFPTWAKMTLPNEIDEFVVPAKIGDARNDAIGALFVDSKTYCIAVGYTTDNTNIKLKLLSSINDEVDLTNGDLYSHAKQSLLNCKIQMAYADGSFTVQQITPNGEVFDCSYYSINPIKQSKLSTIRGKDIFSNFVVKKDGVYRTSNNKTSVPVGSPTPPPSALYKIPYETGNAELITGIGYKADKSWLDPDVITIDDNLNVIAGFKTYQYADAFVMLHNNYSTPIKMVGLFNVDHILVHDKLFAIKDNTVYTNRTGNGTITIDVTTEGESTYFDAHHIVNSNNTYIASDKKLYINENRYNNGNKLLYFPKVNTENFERVITSLQILSSTQIGLFFENSIMYIEKTEHGYTYNKSKLNVGCKSGANVILSYDGRASIFSTDNGLVYLAHQSIIQSDDQVLTFLSDNIRDKYSKFNEKPVILLTYKNYIFCYNKDGNFVYLFDVRNNSWWYWEYIKPIHQLIVTNSELTILSNDKLFKLDYDPSNYCDDYANNTGTILTNTIDWYILSQKLHLGTLNNYKNVASIMLNNVQQNPSPYPLSFNLSIKNYRTQVSDRYNDDQELSYDVDLLRTYVKRCNSSKINEFQYCLKNKPDLSIEHVRPLSLNSIIIKYNIAGQVR